MYLVVIYLFLLIADILTFIKGQRKIQMIPFIIITSI